MMPFLLILYIINAIVRFKRWVFHEDQKKIDLVTTNNRIHQILLLFKYKEMISSYNNLVSFADVEFRAYSQNGEDGILLYIFSLIGTTNKKTIEVCAGHGIECNSANLIINHGWSGLLFDGNAWKVQLGQNFYTRNKDTYFNPPMLVNSWIKRDNINQLIEKNRFSGKIDLLTIDMDGVDYWIFESVNCIDPRVIVLEYNSILGPDLSLTIPYKEDFSQNDMNTYYYGASLTAFVKLARKKGYRLIGCERQGINAFFMKSGVGEDLFPEVTPQQCFEQIRVLNTKERLFTQLREYDWLEV